jgi:hypothetical protein
MSYVNELGWRWNNNKLTNVVMRPRGRHWTPFNCMHGHHHHHRTYYIHSSDVIVFGTLFWNGKKLQSVSDQKWLYSQQAWWIVQHTRKKTSGYWSWPSWRNMISAGRSVSVQRCTGCNVGVWTENFKPNEWMGWEARTLFTDFFIFQIAALRGMGLAAIGQWER